MALSTRHVCCSQLDDGTAACIGACWRSCSAACVNMPLVSV
jgi:hypothetical protein